MRKISAKTFFKTLLVIVVLAVLLFNMGSKTDGSYRFFADEYREYYLYRYEYHKKILAGPFEENPMYSRYWFLPGQKRKLLKKLKDDVINKLEEMVLSDSCSVVDYTIRDDFKVIIIYRDINKKLQDYNPYMSKLYISKRAALYQELLNGHGSVNYQNVVTYEYID